MANLPGRLRETMQLPKIEASEKDPRRKTRMLLVNATAGRSRIHGKGLISRELIPANTVVWVLRPGFDVELTREQYDELSPCCRDQVAKYVYTDMATGKLILCSDDAKYMNHSDAPNTRTDGDKTIALVDIRPGVEITCNYYEFDAATRQTTVFDTGFVQVEDNDKT